MLKEYWFHKDSIPEANSVLMFGLRIIVLAKLQSLMLHRLHEGHFGVDKCRERAKDSGQVANDSCQPKEAQQSLPYVLSTEFSARPWQRVAMDLFCLDGCWCGLSLIVIQDFLR